MLHQGLQLAADLLGFVFFLLDLLLGQPGLLEGSVELSLEVVSFPLHLLEPGHGIFILTNSQLLLYQRFLELLDLILGFSVGNEEVFHIAVVSHRIFNYFLPFLFRLIFSGLPDYRLHLHNHGFKLGNLVVGSLVIDLQFLVVGDDVYEVLLELVTLDHGIFQEFFGLAKETSDMILVQDTTKEAFETMIDHVYLKNVTFEQKPKKI